jgi:hypothetical protein
VRYFNGTLHKNDDIYLPEDELIEKRPDYVPPEIVTPLTKD